MNKKLKLSVNENQVIEYLADHPDFFQSHLDLLEKMYIPHPTGDAVSLIAKQLEILRNKQQEQEQQLTALITIAKENDVSLTRMRQLTLALLEANSLDVLLSNLNVVLTEFFLTDFVVVKLIKNTANQPLDELIIELDDSELQYFSKELSSNQPSCGRPSLQQAKCLFGDLALQIKSCAIIPMVYTNLEGLIGIGSRDESRFEQSMGNLFLMQISELIATRLISILASNH